VVIQLALRWGYWVTAASAEVCALVIH